MGTPLREWQGHVSDVSGELLEGGKLAYPVVVLSVPRQQGKTILTDARKVTRCLAKPGQLVMGTAQSRNDVRDKWEEAVDRLEESAFLRRVVGKVRRSNGSERITFGNRSQWRIFAPTKKGAHGTSPDEVHLDEAWAIGPEVLQAVVFAMRSRPNPQLWVVSTAGTDESVVLRRYVDLGRDAVEQGRTTGVAMFEWSAPDDADPAALETWAACMPELGRSLPVEQVRMEFESLPLGEFTRGALNRWTRSDELVIPREWWAECGTADKLPTGRELPMAFAADVAADRSRATIGACVLDRAGIAWVEVVEQHLGTEWAAPRLLELGRRWHRPVCVDNVGPSSTIAEELLRLGVNAITPSARNLATACATFHDRARDRTLRHRHQAELNEALEVARRRPLADGFAWNRRDVDHDVSALVACTLAVWAAESAIVPGFLA